jgi:hypothetical protein
MSESLTATVTALLWPLLVAIAVVCTPVVAVIHYSVRRATILTSLFVVSFACVGVVLGVIVGGSQRTSAEVLVTGILGLATVAVTYLLSKESLKDWELRTSLPVAVIVLVLETLAGLAVGAAYRKEHVAFERAMTRRMMLYEKVELPLCKEERLIRLKGGSLPADYGPGHCPP